MILELTCAAIVAGGIYYGIDRYIKWDSESALYEKLIAQRAVTGSDESLRFCAKGLAKGDTYLTQLLKEPSTELYFGADGKMAAVNVPIIMGSNDAVTIEIGGKTLQIMRFETGGKKMLRIARVTRSGSASAVHEVDERTFLNALYELGLIYKK